MGYIAIKGGEKAIEEALEAMTYLRTQGAANGEEPLKLDAIEHQLHFLHSRVLSEGGLYDAELASLAIKQALGDPFEAAFFLRAYRCTRSRIMDTPVHETKNMRLIRRISSAFKEIPGGQMLGPTPDYSQRLFNLDLINEDRDAFLTEFEEWMESIEAGEAVPSGTLPKVVDMLREQGLVEAYEPSDDEPYDITRQSILHPLPRSAELAIMSRAESGSILSMAYTTMRHYGDTHPTIAELRVGYMPVEVPHPITGEMMEVGEVLVTEAEIFAMYDPAETEDTPPSFGLGYGACFGHNETKAITMAILDRAMHLGKTRGIQFPAENPEFVLNNIDGIDSMGFTIHYKMPHYVTFLSDLDRIRNTQKNYHEDLEQSITPEIQEDAVEEVVPAETSAEAVTAAALAQEAKA